MAVSFAYAIIFLLTLVWYRFLRRRKPKPEGKADTELPPGSMGWPYIGETLQLYSQDPNVFFSSRQKRYGEIFKTHILGCPSVMLACPEAARFVLVTKDHLFKPTYPRSKERLIGPAALFFHQGDYHTRLRKLVQASLSIEAIRNMVPDIDALVASTMDSWHGGHVVNTFHEMKQISFEVGILMIFGRLEARYREELKKNYFIVDRGYNSFPTNIPGTPYRKALQARKRLSRILSDIISERKEKKLLKNDLVGCLLNSKDEKGEVLTDDQIADNIIGTLFAAQDTTASVMTWIVKYLHDNPKILEAVKAEHKAIKRLLEESNQSLSWSHTRNMPITYKVTGTVDHNVRHTDICSFVESCLTIEIIRYLLGQVILETLRMASIISFTFREAIADVEYKGYLIPKSWKVMPLFRNIHHNPEFFTDPREFDPSRFEVAPKPNTFMPFGTGVHACPGNELAKLDMLIVTHHLVSNFRHAMGSGGIRKWDSVRHARIWSAVLRLSWWPNIRGELTNLAVEAGNPHLVYTCGEDGLVQHVNVRRARNKPVIPLHAIAVDPRHPNLVAVGGWDDYTRLYDIWKYKCDGSTDIGQPTDYFYPPHVLDNSIGEICLAFSDQSGLLVSYKDNTVYLFTPDIELGHNPFIRHMEMIRGEGYLGKEGDELVRVMKADVVKVECVESNPHMAGVDCIKIWTPKAIDEAALQTNIEARTIPSDISTYTRIQTQTIPNYLPRLTSLIIFSNILIRIKQTIQVHIFIISKLKLKS
ncbi:hypothetical protein GQ457_09G031370 [Hibiscus cannabinus]